MLMDGGVWVIKSDHVGILRVRGVPGESCIGLVKLARVVAEVSGWV